MYSIKKQVHVKCNDVILEECPCHVINHVCNQIKQKTKGFNINEPITLSALYIDPLIKKRVMSYHKCKTHQDLKHHLIAKEPSLHYSKKSFAVSKMLLTTLKIIKETHMFVHVENTLCFI